MAKFVWNISERNSTIHFKAKYFQIGLINGRFRKIYGEVIAGALLENPDIKLFIQTSSIDTMDDSLDLKLKSAAVLHVDESPNIIFTAKEGCYISSGRVWELMGFLEFRNRNIPITLVISFFKRIKNLKKTAIQVQLFGRINLLDFGINMPLEIGISDEIEIDAAIVMVKTEEAILDVNR